MGVFIELFHTKSQVRLSRDISVNNLSKLYLSAINGFFSVCHFCLILLASYKRCRLDFYWLTTNRPYLIMQRINSENSFVFILPYRITLVCSQPFEMFNNSILTRLLFFLITLLNSTKSICCCTGKCNYTLRTPVKR